MITVVRSRPKATKFDQAVKAARKMSSRKLTNIRRAIAAQERKENRLKAAAIHRYAKKHGLALEFHAKPWILNYSGLVQVAMPAGYFAVKDGTLHPVVAR